MVRIELFFNISLFYFNLKHLGNRSAVVSYRFRNRCNICIKFEFNDLSLNNIRKKISQDNAMLLKDIL